MQQFHCSCGYPLYKVTLKLYFIFQVTPSPASSTAKLRDHPNGMLKTFVECYIFNNTFQNMP